LRNPVFIRFRILCGTRFEKTGVSQTKIGVKPDEQYSA